MSDGSESQNCKCCRLACCLIREGELFGLLWDFLQSIYVYTEFVCDMLLFVSCAGTGSLMHPTPPIFESLIKYIRQHPAEYFKGPSTHTFILCRTYVKGKKGKNKRKKNEENDLLKTGKTKTYQKSN